MHLRRVKVKSGASHRCYSQIVQSYRRDDGVSAHRVVASLGCLTDEAHENFKLALKASRDGQQVVTLPALPDPRSIKPEACLRYLDLAVLLELWKSKLADIVAEALFQSTTPDAADVVAALALQRCSAPGSKLESVRWLPRTVLPELLGISTAEYNNSRVHRVLDALDAATPGIMSRIAPSFQQSEGFASLFVDVTDTWFEGKGPVEAQRGKTKEGMTKRKIGLVMMCSDQGYPLRWEVCEGNRADSTAMTGLMRKVSGLAWLSGKPVVCDGAMGRPAIIRAMSDAEIGFVTAIQEPDFAGFGCSIPHASFSDIAVSDSKVVSPEDLANATSAAATCGELRKVSDELFVKGLGELTWEGNDVEEFDEATTVRAMRLCQEVEQAIADGATHASASRKCGISGSLARRYLLLSKLSCDIQAAVRAGEGAEYGLGALLRIAESGSPDTQQAEFAALLASPPKRDLPRSTQKLKRDSRASNSVTVKAVAYFSPRYFVESRAGAQRKRAEVEAFVSSLNERARSGGDRYSRLKLLSAVEQELRKHHFLKMFDHAVVQHADGGREYWQVVLKVKEEQWTQKRAHDGFMVVVAHPDLPHGDEELVRLYRDKDRIERDFKTIKGMIQLRPVRHRQIAKIRAHVTVCVLALLLERILAARLTHHGGMTAERALETLEPCRLVVMPLQERRAYASTNLDKAQQGILRHLGMLCLADDRVLADRITPRS